MVEGQSYRLIGYPINGSGQVSVTATATERTHRVSSPDGKVNLEGMRSLSVTVPIGMSGGAVVDADGNAVSATTTIGVLFGSGVYAGGFFLNSSAGNLDARTGGTSRYANSTIAPTLVLEKGALRLAIGAAGSQYIQPATAQVTMRILAFGEDAGAAISAPRIQTSPLRREIEVEPGFSSDVYASLVRAGYRPSSRIADLTFGAVHAIHVRRDSRRVGVADPRRDGSAAVQ
jgi:gamma-glutamyltranspeptidase/glutathione hydrolase